MSYVLTFIGGLVLGGIVGVFVMALATIRIIWTENTVLSTA